MIIGGGIKHLLLDDSMEEVEGFFILGEVTSDKVGMDLSSHRIKLFLESRAPRDAILFFLLDVFLGHVGGVVEQRDPALHNHLAVVTSHHNFRFLHLFGL